MRQLNVADLTSLTGRGRKSWSIINPRTNERTVVNFRLLLRRRRRRRRRLWFDQCGGVCGRHLSALRVFLRRARRCRRRRRFEASSVRICGCGHRHNLIHIQLWRRRWRYFRGTGQRWLRHPGHWNWNWNGDCIRNWRRRRNFWRCPEQACAGGRTRARPWPRPRSTWKLHVWTTACPGCTCCRFVCDVRPFNE